jgi:methionine synthase I (cobalamin-dependent)
MSAFLDRLRTGPCLILDGGLGSMLVARGLAAGASPESWNLERPEDVRSVLRGYVEAGSDAVQTNTFGGHPLRLARAGLDDRLEEIHAEAIRAAQAAGASFVIGDVGPTGEYLSPVGKGDLGVWRDGFARQGRALAGCDAIHVETMCDLREARTALEALAETGLPVMVSMTFDRRKRGFFTLMGDPLVPSLRALLDAGAAAVGANCTLASGDMRALAEEALRGVGGPLVIQPNAGQPEVTPLGPRYAQSPEAFARDLAPFAALGVAALGGCCGTDQRFIAALSRSLGRTA